MARRRTLLSDGMFGCYYRNNKLYIWSNSRSKPVAYVVDTGKQRYIKVRANSNLVEPLAHAFNAKVIRSRSNELAFVDHMGTPNDYTTLYYGSRIPWLKQADQTPTNANLNGLGLRYNRIVNEVGTDGINFTI